VYEHKGEPVLERALFLRRLAASAALGLGAVAISLAVGMIGFHVIEELSWIDSFLNATMLLGGMGPLEHERSAAGKLFEGIYALYSGLAVISFAGIIFAPVIHRFMHKLHADPPPDEGEGDEPKTRRAPKGRRAKAS
jgi:hypothetical protein